KRALHKALRETLPQSKELSEELSLGCDFKIQIPEKDDLHAMNGLPAGGKEDQEMRLTNMIEQIQALALPTVHTQHAGLAKDWLSLFLLIDKGDAKKSFQQLDIMTTNEPLLQLILNVHPINYLKKIIEYCIAAQSTQIKKINNDILITPKTFEILIKDIATTLTHRTPLYFSFGLPTHHASKNEASGFCILNKVVILMNHVQAYQKNPVQHLIIGTDVNRDNGLCSLLHESPHLNSYHMDVYDSRVYPFQDRSCITKELKQAGKKLQLDIMSWDKKHLNYLSIDLSLNPRMKSIIHPALLFALEQLKIQILKASRTGEKIMIYLPTGWDSHEHETAECGAYIQGNMLEKAAAKQCRFNDDDLVYFYQQIIQIYLANNSTILGIYWGLEGGYDKTMYQNQIQLMFKTITNQLNPNNEEHSSYHM
ncbi:MAG: acetylpolyamine aminohydrolase, partial [bacterium]|nr:acetylpolyamine aminohydrolase [bacterium]